MLPLLFFALTAPLAHSMIMEPTFQAAESMGFQIVGEVEFSKDQTNGSPEQLERQVTEIGELCPRTQSIDPQSSSARFVILAWSDHDFPTVQRRSHNPVQIWLAQKRAEILRQELRRHIRGHLNFEIVNMATRKPHLIEAADGEDAVKIRVDIKDILETSGAAPSDPLGFGLFAEYSQAGKALVWVHCKETLVRRKNSSPALVQLARLGAI